MINLFYDVVFYVGSKTLLALLSIGTFFDRIRLWLWAHAFVAGITFYSCTRRARMSHNNAVAGRGTLTIVDNPDFPAMEFFEPGREFKIRVRHATAAYMDDAMLLVRSASIKFADETWESPFDLEMNTGNVTFFWNAFTFMQFAFRRDEKKGTEYQSYYQKFGRGRVGARAGFRRNPDSYVNCIFRSQTPFCLEAKDGSRYLVKWLLEPADGTAESGIVSPESVTSPAQLADQNILPGETRNRNYLKNELRERVGNGGAAYKLRMQLHSANPEDVLPGTWNSNAEWNEENAPIYDLATISLDEILDHEETWWTSFWIGHLPACITRPPARNLHDPNSLIYFRYKALTAIRVRWLSGKLLGIPKPWPDEGGPARNAKIPGG